MDLSLHQLSLVTTHDDVVRCDVLLSVYSSTESSTPSWDTYCLCVFAPMVCRLYPPRGVIVYLLFSSAMPQDCIIGGKGAQLHTCTWDRLQYIHGSFQDMYGGWNRA